MALRFFVFALVACLAVASPAVPSGTYQGHLSVLGITVTANITVDDTNHADIRFDASGLATSHVFCSMEEYSIDDTTGTISLPNKDKVGDCIYNVVQHYGLTIQNLHYDDVQDEIVLTVHYVLNVKLTLSKKNGLKMEYCPAADLGSALTAPSGTYTGDIKVLGIDVTASITIVDSSHADIHFDASGLATSHVFCAAEVYSLGSGGAVSLPNKDKVGDCMYNVIQHYGLQIKSLQFDSTADSIVMTVHYVLDVKLTLSKHGLTLEYVPGTAPVYAIEAL